MATRACLKRLTREYQNIQQNPPPYIVAHPSESDILEWHYIITGPPDTPYAEGQYWGTLNFPPTYPFAPPAIRMHTPSGRFLPSTRLCLTISDFHPKSFNPAWEVSTILVGLLSFMTSEEMSTGCCTASEAERKHLAARSRWWNSTGGGTKQQGTAPGVHASVRGTRNVRAGDGGVKFQAEWPELDVENLKWMKKHKIDVVTGEHITPGAAGSANRGLRRRGGRAGATINGNVPEANAADTGRSWARRHVWVLGALVLLGYAVLSRILTNLQADGWDE